VEWKVKDDFEDDIVKEIDIEIPQSFYPSMDEIPTEGNFA